VVLKRFIRQAQLDAHGPKLQSTADVVHLPQSNLSVRRETSYSGNRRLVDQTLWLVGNTDVNRKSEYVCEMIQGTHNMHSIRSVSALDVNKLLKWSLACFCAACIDESWHNCSNLAWSGDWEVEVLRVDDVGFVQATMKDVSGLGCGMILEQMVSTWHHI
jgi:hypothetical protein